MRSELKWSLTVIGIMMIFPCFSLLSQSAQTVDTAAAVSPEKTVSAVSSVVSSVISQAKSSASSKSGNIIYKVKNHKTGKILSLKASDYIKGVVAAEIPPTYETEAIKAQAVASNTFALRMIAACNPDSGYYFTTDPSKHQAYLSPEEMKARYKNKYNEYYKKISDAVDSVISQVITYKNEPISAVFHSTCGGYTENSENIWGAETPYLKSVKSNDTSSPYYNNKKLVKSDDVKSVLKQNYPKIKLSSSKNEWFKITKRSQAGSVISAKAGSIKITGSNLRYIFGLNSQNISISYDKSKDVFIFESKGFGHCVGMSQYGANELAKQGKDYKEILKHYYTGVKIQKI